MILKYNFSIDLHSFQMWETFKKSQKSDFFDVSSGCGLAQSIERLPLWGISMTVPSFEPHQWLFHMYVEENGSAAC